MTDGKSYYLAVDSTALYETSEAAFERTESLCTMQPVLIQAYRQQAMEQPGMPQQTRKDPIPQSPAAGPLIGDVLHS